jgi:hypothetical protein
LAGALLLAACGAAKAEEAAKASARLATIRLKREDMRIPSWMTGECRWRKSMPAEASCVRG